MVTHRILAAIALVALAGAPIAAPAQTKPAPKAAPKPAAAPAGKFDARDPASLVALLQSTDAKAEVARKTDQEVFLNVTTAGLAFGVQFAGCDAGGKTCKAMAFNTASEKRGATLGQVNSFNQTSLTCRAYQDKAGKMNVMYATLIGSADTRDELRTHVSAWQGCLASFGEFLQNPTGYLAAAP